MKKHCFFHLSSPYSLSFLSYPEYPVILPIPLSFLLSYLPSYPCESALDKEREGRV